MKTANNQISKYRKGYVEVLILLLLFFSTFSYAQGFCHDKCPTAKKNQTIITNHLFTYCNNSETKFPDWVAYRLDTSLTHGSGRPRYWRADPNLPEKERLEPNDFKYGYDSIGVDRGHMVPLGAIDGSEFYYEANYLSNITPQYSQLNRGLWKDLEEIEFNLVEVYDTIWVMAGTLYESSMPQLPFCDEPHTIPSGYWKVIWFDDQARAYIFHQDLREHVLAECEISLKKLVRISRVKLK